MRQDTQTLRLQKVTENEILAVSLRNRYFGNPGGKLMNNLEVNYLGFEKTPPPHVGGTLVHEGTLREVDLRREALSGTLVPKAPRLLASGGVHLLGEIS